MLGWDLGGAHIKVAAVDGSGDVAMVCQLACPLWRGMDYFHSAAAQALNLVGRGQLRHAITMTGELVDFFETRREGVCRLIEALCKHVPSQRLQVYAGQRGFLPPERAIHHYTQVASANWLATASLLAFYLDEGLLVDVGSTTTDIVPFAGRRVLALGFTDHTRLRCGELVYAGVVRTPVMAMVRQVPVGGAWVPLMAECFATAADVYRLLGLLPEYADKLPSADQGEKTPPASARRLARMVGSDLEGGGIGRWRAVAEFLAERQLRRLRSTCDRILSRTMLAPDAPLVGAGVGRFVVQALALRLGRPYVDFCEVLDTTNWGKVNNAADCAGAISVAYLAQR